jgi:membrane-associated phospholipid phosphatase
MTSLRAQPAVPDEAAPGGTSVALPPRIAARRAVGAQRFALMGVGGFVAIFAAVRAKRTEAVDLAITIRWQRVHHPLLGRAMAAVSWPGFPPESRIIPIVLMATEVAVGMPTEAAFQLLAWLTGAISEGLKFLMRRPRPIAGTDLRVVAAQLGGSSFPSGHVITYVGTYGWLAYTVHSLLRPRWPRRIIVACLCGLIAAVGPSRIYQGHHWPTDVAASYLLGMSYLTLLVAIHRRVRDRARTKSA